MRYLRKMEKITNKDKIANKHEIKRYSMREKLKTSGKKLNACKQYVL